ncbi:hypothetical protein D3C81_1541010 [compost metagenome]
MIFAQHIERIHTVIGGFALIPQRSQLIGQQAAVDRMIVNHQNHHVIVGTADFIRGRQRAGEIFILQLNAIYMRQQRRQLVR